MIVLLCIYVIQIFVIVAFKYYLSNFKRRFTSLKIGEIFTEEKQLQIEITDELKSFNTLMLLIELLPIFGFLLIAVAFYRLKTLKRQKLNKLLTTIQEHNDAYDIFAKLPTTLIDNMNEIKAKMEALKQLDFHYFVAEKSYDMLLSIVKGSYYQEVISEESVRQIKDAINQTNILLDELLSLANVNKQTDREEYQMMVNKNFEKYQSVMKNIITDIYNRQSVF